MQIALLKTVDREYLIVDGEVVLDDYQIYLNDAFDLLGIEYTLHDAVDLGREEGLINEIKLKQLQDNEHLSYKNELQKEHEKQVQGFYLKDLGVIT